MNNFLKQINFSFNVHRVKKEKASKRYQDHLAKYVPRFQSRAPLFTCSEECPNDKFISAEMFAKHYVECHKYPLLYYEQPMRLKLIEMRQSDRLMMAKVLHRCVIRFAFESDKFFLLEHFQVGVQKSTILYEITENKKSKYVYELEPMTSNVTQGEKKCFVIADLHS